MNRLRALTAAASLVGIVMFSGVSGQAYSTFGKWASTSVPFYLNPQNGSVSADDAEKAFKTALDAWSDATKSPFSYSYGGRVDDTSLGYDGRNVAVFRTDADASEIARTYVWSLNGTIIDADIVFSDVRLTFFTGTSGCEEAGEGGYIEDVGAHELGHALGLLDSRVIGATMAADAPPCSQSPRTLDADDVAGLQQLYGAAAAPSAPTGTTAAPATAPATGAPAKASAPASTSTSTSRPPSPSSGTSPAASATGPRDTQLPASLRQPATQTASTPPSGGSSPQMASNSNYAPPTGSNSPARVSPSAAARPSTGDRSPARTSSRSNGADDRETPAAADVPVNTPPWITITSPTSASFRGGQMVTFVGMAVDAEDGKLTGSLVWTSSVAGQIGVGGQFSKALPEGTHVITATVSDANGAVATQEVTIRVVGSVPTLVPATVPVAGVAPPPLAFAAPLPAATASAYTINRSPRVDLTWSGFAARTVDVFRDGTKVITTPNDGAFTDKPGTKAAGSYTYRVCVTGTSVCSAGTRIAF